MFYYLQQLDTMIAALVSFVDDGLSGESLNPLIDEKLATVKLALV